MLKQLLQLILKTKKIGLFPAPDVFQALFFDVFRENRVFIYVDILKCKKEDRKETKFFIITFTPLRQGLPLPFLWNKHRFRYILSL